MPEYSIGVDLGGTNLRAAAIDSGEMLEDLGNGGAVAGRDAVIADMVKSIEACGADGGQA